MNALSHWASRHAKLAIGLIILLEIGKGWIGVHLGFRALPALPPMGAEVVLVALLAGVMVIKRRYYRYSPSLAPEARRRLRRVSSFGLFTLSFGLAILMGNRCQQIVNPQTGDWTAHTGNWTAQAASYASERAGVASENTAEVRGESGGKSSFSRREGRRAWKLALRAELKRIKKEGDAGYVLLFILGLGVTFVLAAVACNLSCNNHAVAAILVGILALGSLVAGVYFLSRALRRKKPETSTP